MSAKLQRGAAFGALRHPSFRLFFGGLVLSSFGSTFTQLAISWQIYQITGSPLQLGLLGLSRAFVMMPMLLFGGMLADSFDRRKLLMFTQFGQLSLSLSLLVLTATDAIVPLHFYIVAVTSGFLLAVENPARLASVPNMVPESDLTNAIALNGMQWSISSIAGPPIAGVILGFFGAVANYAIDAMTFVAMILALLLVRPVNKQMISSRRMSVRSIGDGFGYVSKHPILLLMMLLDFVANIFGSVIALLPVYASDIFKVGPQGFGVLSGASSIGSIAGGVLMGVVGKVRRMGLSVLVAIAMFATCAILFSYNTNFYLALALLAGEGFSDTISMILRTTILQLNVPDDLRGRVTSLNQVFTTGGGPLGSFRAGAMGELVGPEMAVLSGGLVVLGFVLFVGTSVPFVRRYVREPASLLPA